MSGEQNMTNHWRHKSTGNLYVKVDEAIDCTNGHGDQPMVLYHKLIYPGPTPQLFVRELEEFEERFERID